MDHKRRNYFIDKKFQGTFILKFSLIVLAGGVFTTCITYFLALQSTTVAFVNSKVVARTTADFILPILIQTVILVTIGIAIAAGVLLLMFSHKIAGPLYRFKKVMESLEKGEFPSEFRIRQYDQLQGLADSFNGMIKKTKAESTQLKQDLSTLKGKISGISEEGLPEEKRRALSEIKEILSGMDKVINHFKI